jgi:Ca-activated chloride channel family protein
MSELDRRQANDLDPERPADRPREGTRRRVVVAVLLLALTVAGGVGARMAGGGAPISPGDDPGAVLRPVADPDGSVRLGARVDRTRVLQGGDGLVKLELTITGEPDGRDAGAVRTPTDLVVVLDRSGSMQGAPIAHALAAVRRLMDALGPDDRFALVSYASSATTSIALASATDAARAGWIAALARIGVGGGTNMASGLDRAHVEIERSRLAGRAARVVLISDGHANEGDHSRGALLTRTARAVSGEYVVSAVGVGEGFDESLMTALADAGTGNFYFVQRADDLGDVFAGEFASARAQLASALEVQIRPAPGTRVVSAAGYPLSVDGDRISFRPGPLFAGQERRVWLSFQVPTDGTPGDAAPRALGDVTLRYVRDGSRRTLALADVPEVELVAGREAFVAGLDADAWADSVVADELGALKAQVSTALQRGDAPAAVAELRAFRAKQRALNADVASPAVARVVEDVAAMEEAVEQAARSSDAGERNRLSKQYRAEGYDVRRPGAKYDVDAQ